jgi:hypothetical protein
MSADSDTPSFKMTDFRLLKLKRYFLDKFMADNPFSTKKSSVKAVNNDIKALKAVGKIHHVYYVIVKNGLIDDFDLYPDKYIPTESALDSSLSSSGLDRSQAPVIAPKKKVKKVGRVIHFDPDTLQKLIEKSERMDCSYSHLVRQAVNRYLGI